MCQFPSQAEGNKWVCSSSLTVAGHLLKYEDKRKKKGERNPLAKSLNEICHPECRVFEKQFLVITVVFEGGRVPVSGTELGVNARSLHQAIDPLLLE